MGYKNLPVLSIEEFYEQRVRDGWFPSADQVQQSLMDKAKQVGKLDSLTLYEAHILCLTKFVITHLKLTRQDPEAAAAQVEAEEAEKESKEERDDEEELAKKRGWDEYRDEHKRGEGNMHNKG